MGNAAVIKPRTRVVYEKSLNLMSLRDSTQIQLTGQVKPLAQGDVSVLKLSTPIQSASQRDIKPSSQIQQSILHKETSQRQSNLTLTPTPQSNSTPQSSLTIEKSALLDEVYAKAKASLTIIEDLLWRRICQDILDMMGPTSFFKMWQCQIGEIASQDKLLNIGCKDEETARFVQQYDFVILGSIKKFFPALKEVRVERINP